MAEGDVVQNVNPRPTGSPPTTKYVAPPKKPEGPVLEQRRVQAALKAGMVVDARIYGVKPMALSKYINDMIKPSPFMGVVYNKAMMGYAKINAYYTKGLTVGINNLVKEIVEFRKSYVPTATTANNLLRSMSQQEKDLATKPTLTTKILGDIAKGDADERRRRLYSEREAQKNAYDPTTDPVRGELEITNAELKKIISSGSMEAKKAREAQKPSMVEQGLLGMLNKIPMGALIFADAVAIMEIWKSIQLGIGAIKDTAEARKTSEDIDRRTQAGIAVTEQKLVAQGRSPEDAAKFRAAQEQYKNVANLSGTTQSYLPGVIADITHTVPAGQLIKAVKMGLISPWEALTFTPEKFKQRMDEKEAEADKIVKTLSGKFQAERAGTTVAPGTTPTSFTDESKAIMAAAISKGKLPEGVNPLSEKAIKRIDSYDQYIKEAASAFGIRDTLIKGVIAQESRGDPKAMSTFKKKGGEVGHAYGLMQLLPDTANDMGIKDLFDPRQNIMAGTRYLAKLKAHYKGDELKAVAAYNAGMGNVDKWKGNIPFAETAGYVKGVPAYESVFAQRVAPKSDNVYAADITNVAGQITSTQNSAAAAAANQQNVLAQKLDMTNTLLSKANDINGNTEIVNKSNIQISMTD